MREARRLARGGAAAYSARVPPTPPERAAFRAGIRAAVPIWLAFVPTSFALGLAAKSYGLGLGEIVLMSALVYAGPAQFAALEPLAAARPAAQVILTTVLINLRFAVMGAAIAPYFRGAGRLRRLVGSHVLSASSFVLPYAHFQRRGAPPRAGDPPAEGRANLDFYLGVGLTSFVVWVIGSGLGYLAALSVPGAFREALRFLLPGYFASLLAVELRRGTALAVTVASFVAAVPAARLDADWGWLVSAVAIATAGVTWERWTRARS